MESWALRISSGLEGVPSNQAGPVKSAIPPVAYLGNFFLIFLAPLASQVPFGFLTPAFFSAAFTLVDILSFYLCGFDKVNICD